MAVKNVDLEPAGQFARRIGGGEVAPAEKARHRHAVNAERREGLKPSEALGSQPVGGQAVDDNADLMAARPQFLGEVRDMPEQSADRGAENLKYAQRGVGHRARASARR